MGYTGANGKIWEEPKRAQGGTEAQTILNLHTVEPKNITPQCVLSCNCSTACKQSIQLLCCRSGVSISWTQKCCFNLQDQKAKLRPKKPSKQNKKQQPTNQTNKKIKNAVTKDL